jgi:hypothetical protein
MTLCVALALGLLIASVILFFMSKAGSVETALWAIAVILLCGAKVAF